MAETELDSRVFSAPVRRDLIHSVVVGQMAARRSGTAATKNRSLVSGGGRKPFRQKGTGRARQGSTRVAQLAGGGVAFGPQPRSYRQKIPKKVRKAALRAALSLRNGEGCLEVVETIEVPDAKTRQMVAELDRIGTRDVLIVTAERDSKLERAGRNLPTVRVLSVAGLNVRDILARKKLVLTREAVALIVERLQ